MKFIIVWMKSECVLACARLALELARKALSFIAVLICTSIISRYNFFFNYSENNIFV